MWKILSSCFIVLLVIMTVGCLKNESTVTKSEVENEKNSPQVTPIKRSNHFSYLESFSKEDKHKYSNFLKVGSSNELKGFNPKRTLLIFFDMVENDDINGIYNLTFKDSNLPTRDEFEHLFTSNEGIYNHVKNDVLKYRWFDKIEENYWIENKASAVISISLGSFTTSTAYSFKKNEAGVWQIELSHMLNTRY
jgi:hypothetical protein